MSLSQFLSSEIPRYALCFELIFGGLIRIFPRLFPSANQRAMEKAAGYWKYLTIIPGRNPSEHSINIGRLMLVSGILMGIPRSKLGGFILMIPSQQVAEIARIGGAALGTALAVMGVYSQRRMGVPYWLPCINTVLGSLTLLGEWSRRW